MIEIFAPHFKVFLCFKNCFMYDWFFALLALFSLPTLYQHTYMHTDETSTFCVQIAKVFPISLSFILSSCFSRRVLCPALVWDLFGRMCNMMNPYLVRKFTLLLPTKITPADGTTLGNRTTREWGRAGATASLNIPLFRVMSTCVHRKMCVCKVRKKNKFSNL